MKLKKSYKNWNKLAKTNPLWTVLTIKEFKNKKWDVKKFFQTGKYEINETMQYLKKSGIDYSKNSALDFGCGIGRLTQSLCNYFNKCIGIDISDEMIKLANQYNRNPLKCQYMINTENNLKLFSDNSFDFILSHIVLQHIKKSIIYDYIKEFLRIVKNNGIIIFQLPYKPKFKKRIKNILKKIIPECILNIYRKITTGTTGYMNMCWIDSAKIEKYINQYNGIIIDKIPYIISGYYSYKYMGLLPIKWVDLSQFQATYM